MLLLFSGIGEQTGIARFSLAPANTPSSRTSHNIIVRARVLATPGKIRTQLWEGDTARTGVLESAALTTSFANYTIPIPDADAALIKGYTNLELRVWGFTTQVSPAVTFEVAEVQLQIPSGTTFNAWGYDTGVGADSGSATSTGPVGKSASDFGAGQEAASVSSNITPSIDMPGLALEVSFDADSGPTYKESVVIARPALYYRLNDISGNALPQVGGLALTVNGGVTRQAASLLPGDLDASYDFNGSTGRLEGMDNGFLDTDLLTFEVVVNPDSVTANRGLGQRFSYTNDIAIWQFSLVDSNPFVQVRDADGITYWYRSTSIIPTGVATHLAFVIRLNSVEIYINGLISDFFPKSWETLTKDVSSSLNIAAYYVGIPYSQHTANYDGKMDEPAIYTTDLPHEDISYHSKAREAVSAYSWTLISGDLLTNSYLKQLTLKRGAQDMFRDPETGVLTGVLHNQDRRFDPGNSSSPYYPNLKPSRPARLRATKDGVSYDMFRGDIEDWPQDWQGRLNEVPVTALDAFDVLSGVDLKLTRPEETSGQRINAILDAAAWPSELRAIDTGLTTVQAWTNKEGSARELLFLVVQAETGHTWVGGNGMVIFKQRNARLNTPFSVISATFSNIPTGGELPLTQAIVVEDKDFIKNHVRIKIMDTQLSAVAQDAQSILDHRKRSHEAELPVVDLTEAQAKADWIISLFKNPQQRIKEVVLEPQQNPAMWVHCLQRDIGDKIRFKIYPVGPGSMLDLYAHIEGIEHRYSVKKWVTIWKLSPADTGEYWILDSDNLDQGTKLAY